MRTPKQQSTAGQGTRPETRPGRLQSQPIFVVLLLPLLLFLLVHDLPFSFFLSQIYRVVSQRLILVPTHVRILIPGTHE